LNSMCSTSEAGRLRSLRRDLSTYNYVEGVNAMREAPYSRCHSAHIRDYPADLRSWTSDITLRTGPSRPRTRPFGQRISL